MLSSVFGWVGRVLLWLVILTASAILAVMVVIPRIAGGTPYTILTGSMRPWMPPGTLVVIRPIAPEKITVGMVVTYQLKSGEPQVVTHRVISQGVRHDGELIFQTKGDANRVPDQKWVRAVQIRGQRWYSIRYLGYLNVLFTGRQHQLLLYGAALGLSSYAIVMFVGGARDRRRKTAQPAHAATELTCGDIMIIRLLRDVRVRAALALGAVLAVGVTGTYASWTDSVPVSGITFSSGKLDLQVNHLDSVPSYTGLTMSNMVPGSSTAGILTVENNGTIPLTYYADASTGTGNLGTALGVKVTGDTGTTGTGLTITCAGQPLNGSGTKFTSGLIGTSTAPRSLAPGASDTFCIQATLPASADSSLQGQSISVTITFNASQVTS